jgi:hypothetical protein
MTISFSQAGMMVSEDKMLYIGRKNKSLINGDLNPQFLFKDGNSLMNLIWMIRGNQVELGEPLLLPFFSIPKFTSESSRQSGN